MTKILFTVSLLAALVSCETPEPTAAETRETLSNIYAEKAEISRDAARARQRAANQLDAAQGYGTDTMVGDALEDAADNSLNKAEQLESDSRMMSRGAAN